MSVVGEEKLIMSLEMVLYLLAVFFFAGCVKGVVGLGLPTISIALVAAVLGLKEAMVLLIIPSLVTNMVQAITGPHLKMILGRIWVFLLGLGLFTWGATGVLVKANPSILTFSLGGILIIYATVSLCNFRITIPKKKEKWLSPIFGSLTGVSTGLTGTFVVPGVLYLQALGLEKNSFVQAMGICFTTATLAIGLSLGGRGVLSMDLTILSGLAVIPALIGMKIGSLIRDKLPERTFKKVFFLSLLVLGGWIAIKTSLL